MKPVTSQHFPAHKHTRTLPASNAARMACLVLAVIVALAQPIQAQNEPPDTQQIRTELGKVVTDLRAAMAQLARIEAEAATLPKTFTAGGQTQNRWNQLNGEKERWTTEQNNALERYDQLVVRSEPLPSGNAAIADLLTICTQLLARNDVMLKTAQSKLSGIERTLRSGPSTFAKGNEIEVWQTQLNRERDYWTGNLATLGKEHEKLAAQFATLKVRRTAQAAPNTPGLSFPAPAPAVGAAIPASAPAVGTAIPASVPSVPANDKTFALLDDLVKAIRAWQQYMKEGNEVEATIQSDKINNSLLYKELRGSSREIGYWRQAPEEALAALAKYRADYPALRAKHDKKHALEVAIAARRKEEADKESAERRRVDEEKAKASALQEAAAAASVSDKPPYDFTFGHLPFGLEKEDVVRLLEKRPEIDKAIPIKGVVGSKLYGDIDAIGRTCATGLFSARHLPPRTDSCFSFHPNLTANKSYLLPVSPSGSKEKVHLGSFSAHFYRTSPISTQYFLFAVNRQYNSASVESKLYSSSFDSVRTLLTKEVGSESVAIDYTTQKDKELKGAIWELPDYWVWLVMEKTVLASTFDNGASTARDFWKIGYIHKPGLTKYLRSIESAKAPNQSDFDILNVMVLVSLSGKTDKETSADAERLLRSVQRLRQEERGNNQ